MSRRSPAPLLVLALFSPLALPARAARALSQAEATCSEFPGLNTLFRFGTGSRPTGSPVIGLDGSIYVGTTEGYVHALHADGSYHWSYTVKGSVTGRMAVSGAGLVMVPTPRNIYAIRPDGSLLWSFTSPVAIQGDLAADQADRFHFASEDGRVFAISSRGALVSHIPGKVRVTAGPIVLRDGAIAAGREDGAIVQTFRGVFRRFTREAPISSLITCPGMRFCAIAGGVLSVVDPKDIPFRTPALSAAQNGELLSTLAPGNRLEVFAGTRAPRSFAITLPEAASAAPAVDQRGTTYIPLKSGALLTVARNGSVSGCVAVGSSPLGVPVVDTARRRVLVTASEGLLASVELD